MRGWIRRGWIARVGRSRPLIVWIVLGVLVPLAPAVYIAVSSTGRPPVPKVEGVHGVRTFKPHIPDKPRDGAVRRYRPGSVAWPAARSGTVALTEGHAVRVAGTPVSVQAVPAADGTHRGPSSVAVTVADHDAAAAAGVNGTVFTVASKDGAAPLRIGLKYKGFAGAYGGNFGSRLRLVSLPACALTTPHVAGCQTRTPLADGKNDVRAASVYATVSARASTPMVLAATSTSGGDGGGSAGTFNATDLKPSGSWSAGGSSGSFTYGYPIGVPPAASALVPTMGLSYDSGSVDGQTAATQAQASWAGDGWSVPRSFIEQSFTSCSNSPEGSASPKSTSDQCYDGPILMMSLNGSSTALVWDSGKRTFTPADDNGEVVTHVTDSGNGSGTYNTDYWRVTDQTGTTYTFGRNHLPGWSSGDSATNSVDSEPVFSAHSGDPCFDSSGFDASVCTMAYRWNLDYVTDVHGNAMAYYYKQDSGAYAENGHTSSATAYVRDSHLDHIDYGFTDGAAYSVNGGHAPDQILLKTGDRCLSGTCDPLNSTNAVNWPDVPFDLNCTAGSSCQVPGPSFWSTVRLTDIKTQQWNGTAYAPVDSWALNETLPATGDGTAPTLWLSSITHTGSDTTAGGAAVTLPPVTFTPIALQNRVATHDGLPIMTRNRISSITTETGQVIGVDYEKVTACSWPVSTDPADNTASCFPVFWTPAGFTQQIKDWFNKWSVASVTQADRTGGAPTMFTAYSYSGGGAWHFDDNEIVKAKYRTYGQWRGFGDVKTFTGQGNDPQTETETTYYRGMSNDNNSTTVTLTDSQGGAHEDIDQLAGNTLETTGYDYSGGSILHSTINSYWVSPPTASRSRSGLPALTANATGEVEIWTRDAVSSSGTVTWRKTETDTAYDTDTSSPTFAQPLVEYAHGDLSDTSQRRCAVTTYAPANTGKNLAGLPAEVETDALACGGSNPNGASAPTAAQTNALTPPATVNRPDDVVADQRTYYDNPTLATTWPQPTSPAWPQAAPTAGDISEVRLASDYTGGAFSYQVKSASTYDTIGRPVDSYDALGHKTHIDYTMTNGLTTGVRTTNPLGQATSQTVDALRGLPTQATDANGIATTTQYDGLGRATAVWGFGRATTSAANAKFTYQVSATAPTAVTTQRLSDFGTYAVFTTLYDALLRVRQTQAVTPEGGRLVSDTFYDTRGWAWKKNTRWWDSGSGPSTSLVTVPDSQVHNQDVVDFDGAGRPVLDTSYDDSHVKSENATAYQGDRNITVPLNESGATYDGATATATLTDALGRTTELDSYTQPPAVTVATQGTPPITRVAISGGTAQATKYTFNKVGQQTDVKDMATGEDWNTSYNLLGQATGKNDPDAGASTTRYDDAGNLLETTDSRGRTISFTYDPLNRKTGKYDAAVSAQSPSNQMAAWVYDNSNNAVAGMTDPIGQLTTATSFVDGNAYTVQAGGFNAHGESTGETITIPASEGALAGPYTIGHTYTANNALPKKDSYPASPGGGSLPAEGVTHSYAGELDFPVSMGGLTSYTFNVTATPFSQIAEEVIGNNGGAHAFIDNTFDLHTGTLSDTKLTNTAISSTPIDETAYTYDPVGNPTRQTETRQGSAAETQCYTYDALDRLKQAWTATDNCAADPSVNGASTVGSGITGGAYWTTWTLDPLGQRTKQTQHGLNGAADTATTYTYNTDQPNTLASTSTTGPSGSTSTSYGYDKVGNTSTRTTPAQGQQALTWSDDGLLTAVTNSSGGSSYIYDANGNLLLQKDPGTTILYLPNEQISLNTSTGAITGTRFYALPGGGQAERTGPGTAFSFQVGDQHATTDLTVDSTLSNPVWRQQTPYGDVRGTPPAIWPDNRGFLNQPNDTATGLTDIGARWYDPTIGRFASLDPAFEPNSPQEQNGYSYAAANPITNSDPTGLRVCDGGSGEFRCEPGQRPDGKPTAGRGSPACEDFGDCGIDHSGHPTSGPAADISDFLARQRAMQRLAALQRKIAALKARLEQLKRECSSYSPYSVKNGLSHCLPNGASLSDLTAALSVVSAGLIAAAGCLDAEADIVTCGPALRTAGSILGCTLTLCPADPVESEAGAAKALRGIENNPAGQAIASELSADLKQESAIQEELQGLCPNSFVGTTKVVMADGTTKPIDKIKVGDKIKDALPGATTGTADRVHKVTAVHITHTDHTYTDVTIATPTGSKTITGTSHHLYWDITTRAWTPADRLHTGDRLQSTDGRSATIAALRTYAAEMITYNLTVDALHTYYVEAGTTPVLVHNCGDLPRPYVNPKGNWTNDLYTVRRQAMAPHMTGSTDTGKSQFLFNVEAEKVTLDAAAYADANDLWVGNKARVYIRNGPVGVVGRSGELTNWIRVTREGRMIHAWPIGPPSG